MSLSYITRFTNALQLLKQSKPVFIKNNPLCSLVGSDFSDKANVCAEDNKTGLNKKRKTVAIPKVTLISGNYIKILTLDEAQKISKRRDLKLVKLVDLDTKTQRPVYKLMTGTEYHEEDLKQRELKKKEKQNTLIKGEKLTMVNGNISMHDLNVQIQKMHKWVNKQYEIRTVISSHHSTMEKAENIYNVIENSLKEDARIVQKRTKGTDIKFQILPKKKDKNPDDKDS